MSNIKKFDASILKYYNWPCEPGQVWRRLTDYEVYRKNGTVIDDMMVSIGHYVVKGTLLARPGTGKPALENVTVHFQSYSIDFGKSADDPARGYWIQTKDDIWYKLERPSPGYTKVASIMEKAVANFLQLHDTLRNEDLSLTTVDKMRRVTCKDTIDDYYTKTTEANHGIPMFNLKFVKDNARFVLDHVRPTLDGARSSKFILSLAKHSDLDTKGLYALFPDLKQALAKQQDPRKRPRDEPPGEPILSNHIISALILPVPVHTQSRSEPSFCSSCLCPCP
jgi:hypothetical protein